MRAVALACLLLVAIPATAQDIDSGEIEFRGEKFRVILRPSAPIPPPPVNRSIWGAQLADTGAWIRDAPAGSVVRVVGEGFGTQAGQAWFAGLPGEVVAWSDVTVTVRLPRVDRHESGKVSLQTAAWELISVFDFGIQPRGDNPPPPPPPPPPGQGPVQTGTDGLPGAPVRLYGTGFGDVKGQVLQDGQPVEIVQWLDTLIVVTSRESRGAPVWSVQRPDGQWYSSGGVAVLPVAVR